MLNNKLWEVKSVSVSDRTITISTPNAKEEDESKTRIKIDTNRDYVFYKRIDPYTYYLNMLGAYLYHIFFVGLGGMTKNRPIIINIAENALLWIRTLSQSSSLLSRVMKH